MIRRLAQRHVVKVLNRALEADPAAINEFVKLRVPCNEALADDPSVIVSPGPWGFRVGPIGVINGLLGLDHRICYYLDDTERIIKFAAFEPRR